MVTETISVWARLRADLSHDENVEDKNDDERNDGVDERVDPRPDVLKYITAPTPSTHEPTSVGFVYAVS